MLTKQYPHKPAEFQIKMELKILETPDDFKNNLKKKRKPSNENKKIKEANY